MPRAPNSFTITAHRSLGGRWRNRAEMVVVFPTFRAPVTMLQGTRGRIPGVAVLCSSETNVFCMMAGGPGST